MKTLTNCLSKYVEIGAFVAIYSMNGPNFSTNSLFSSKSNKVKSFH